MVSKKQHGFIMLTLMISLALAAAAGAYEIKKMGMELDRTQAKATGLKIAQINNAIRKRLADDGSNAIPAIYSGVDWLHSAVGCPGGLAGKTYLPCEIDGNFFFNLTPTTTVTNVGGTTAATTNLGVLKTNINPRLDLANIVTLTANSENLTRDTPIAGTFYSYTIDGANNIIATSTYSAGLDQWLRTDGTNPMKNKLDLGANQISNLGAALQNTACTGAGLAQENGEVLGCVNNKWKKQRSEYWLDPVSTFTALPTSDPIGAVRLTLDTARAFEWTGSLWKALAVDQNGVLTAGKVQLNDVVTEGTACFPNGLLSRDAPGLTLSCQSGRWKNIDPDWSAPTIYDASTTGTIRIVTTAVHSLCTMSMAGTNTQGGYYRCHLIRNADSTWTLNNAASVAGGYNPCEGMCFD